MVVAERRVRWAQGLLFMSVFGVLAIAAERPAQGNTPIEDEQVLARVPARRDPAVQRMERLRRANDVASQLELARLYLEASRTEGDPRYLGAAEGVLAPLPASAPVRVLRATLLQSRHDFRAALRELELALADGEDAQARLTQATVRTVVGDYAGARQSCAALGTLAPYRAACEAPIDALNGHFARAKASLEDALARVGSRTEQRAWLHSLLGEQAYWHDELGPAELRLRAALADDPSDRYTRALLADVLLDRDRLSEVSALLGESPRDDALALRAALANPQSEAMARVEASFAESRARGDAVHQREEARMWLARGDRPRALRCALESWAVQHEPWDARVVLEAARTRAEAAPVLAWLANSRFEAPRLLALASRLEAP